MERKTSIEAYNAIKENGLLSRLRFKVYDYVFHNGPVAQFECYMDLISNGANFGSILTRFSELERLGCLEVVGEKLNPNTGFMVNVWDVTDKTPLPREKKTPLEHLRAKIVKQEKRVFTETQKLKKLRLEYKKKTQTPTDDNMSWDI